MVDNGAIIVPGAVEDVQRNAGQAVFRLIVLLVRAIYWARQLQVRAKNTESPSPDSVRLRLKKLLLSKISASTALARPI